MRALIGVAVLSLVAGAVPAAPPRRASAARPAPHTPHVIPTSGALGALDLIAIAKFGAKVADDQFSDDPTLQYVGRDFVLPVPPSEIVTNFDKDAHVLKVSTPVYSDTIDLLKQTTEGQYTGQNGFGAKATITKVRGEEYGVWLPGKSYNRVPVTFERNMSGPEARELSNAIRLRIYGTIVRADGSYAQKNSALFAKPLLSDATIASPIDIFVHGYFVAVTFNKAEWIDSRSGAIIETWHPDSPAQPS